MQDANQFKDKVQEIEEKLGYKFNNPELLKAAFIHRSFYLDKIKDNRGDNERLEFLGDSVLSLIVTSFLFDSFSELSEGELTQLKEQIVDSDSLMQYTKILDIESYCLVGKGEKKSLQESSILADLFEAVLGAIYIDGGYEKARLFFLKHFQELLEQKTSFPKRNWKKELQERAQKERHELPTYITTKEEGPAHKKHFHVSVKVQNQVVGKGVGMSRKEAEMSAAKDAIEKQEKQ